MDFIFQLRGSRLLLLFVFMNCNTISAVEYVMNSLKANTICAVVNFRILFKADKGKDSVVVHVIIFFMADIRGDMVMTVFSIEASVMTVW